MNPDIKRGKGGRCCYLGYLQIACIIPQVYKEDSCDFMYMSFCIPKLLTFPSKKNKEKKNTYMCQNSTYMLIYVIDINIY